MDVLRASFIVPTQQNMKAVLCDAIMQVVGFKPKDELHALLSAYITQVDAHCPARQEHLMLALAYLQSTTSTDDFLRFCRCSDPIGCSGYQVIRLPECACHQFSSLLSSPKEVFCCGLLQDASDHHVKCDRQAL